MHHIAFAYDGRPRHLINNRYCDINKNHITHSKKYQLPRQTLRYRTMQFHISNLFIFPFRIGANWTAIIADLCRPTLPFSTRIVFTPRTFPTSGQMTWGHVHLAQVHIFIFFRNFPSSPHPPNFPPFRTTPPVFLTLSHCPTWMKLPT